MTRIWHYKFVVGFGYLNLGLLLLALISPLHFQTVIYAWPAAASQMLLHLLVSAALVYAGHQQLARSDIGQKAYPAALVSYLLWSCMMFRWVSG